MAMREARGCMYTHNVRAALLVDIFKLLPLEALFLALRTLTPSSYVWTYRSIWRP